MMFCHFLNTINEPGSLNQSSIKDSLASHASINYSIRTNNSAVYLSGIAKTLPKEVLWA